MTASSRRIIAIGWQLEAAEIAQHEVSLCDDRAVAAIADAISSARALLLSCDAISGLWERAVGECPRQFRSAAREEEAWRRLVQLLIAVRRLLDRGGELICRLDLPSPACRVGKGIEHSLFPKAAQIDCYDALAMIHPLFGELAANRCTIGEGDVERIKGTHPAQCYLEELQWTVAPAVAWRKAPAVGQVLARTVTSLPVSVAAERIVCLPRLARQDPVLEAIMILEMLDTMTGGAELRATVPTPRNAAATRGGGTPIPAGLPRLDGLRRQEAELTRQIAALEQQRLALATRRELAERYWIESPGAGTQPLAARLERLMSLLGFFGPPGRPAWIAEEVSEPVKAQGASTAVLDHTALIMTGFIEVGPDQRRPVVWFNGPPLQSPGRAGGEVEFREALRIADGMQAIVVPVPELARATSALLLAGGNDEVARAIRRSLTKASGVFCYSPGSTLLSGAERKLLQAG